MSPRTEAARKSSGSRGLGSGNQRHGRAPGCFRFSRGGVGGEEVESFLGRGERGDQAEEALLPRGRGAGGLAFAGGAGTVGTLGPGPGEVGAGGRGSEMYLDLLRRLLLHMEQN